MKMSTGLKFLCVILFACVHFEPVLVQLFSASCGLLFYSEVSIAKIFLGIPTSKYPKYRFWNCKLFR